MINQRWLYTKQAIQRYLYCIIFLFGINIFFVKLALNFQ